MSTPRKALSALANPPFWEAAISTPPLVIAVMVRMAGAPKIPAVPLQLEVSLEEYRRSRSEGHTPGGGSGVGDVEDE